MKIDIDPQRIKKYFPSFKVDEFERIDTDNFEIFFPDVLKNLENLLIDYSIDQNDVMYFYFIFREYVRTGIEAMKWKKRNDKAYIDNREMLDIYDFFAKFGSNPKIQSMTIERSKGDNIKIEAPSNLQLFFNEYIFKNFKKEMKYIALAYIIHTPPTKGKFQGKTDIVKEKIRSLNSCLLKFIEQYQIDYCALTPSNQIPDKSPETFVHDFLLATNLIYNLIRLS